MKSSLLIMLVVITYSWSAKAQNRLQELEKNRTYYQKKVAAANTKPNGLNLRAVDEEIVAYVVNKGYETTVQAPSSSSKIAVRAPHNPSEILTYLKTGDQVIVYERQGKHAFLVRTEHDVIGLIHKEAFGLSIHEFPLEVLMSSLSPEEQAEQEQNGVVEQKKMTIEFN